MKFVYTLFVVFLALPTLQAEVSQGSHRIGLNGGVGIPTSANDFSDSAKIGPGGGVSYLYQWTEQIGVGAQVNYFGFPAEDRRLTTKAGGLLDAESDSTVGTVEIIGRYSVWTDRRMSPYVKAGVGVNSFSQETEGKPVTGSTWADTGTSEKRTVADDSSVGYAASIGVGTEANVTDRLIVGLEALWHVFGVSDSDFGTSTINVPSVMLHLGWKI